MDWLGYYDTVAEEIDDEILDEADERWCVWALDPLDPNLLPDSYYIWCAQQHYNRVTVV